MVRQRGDEGFIDAYARAQGVVDEGRGESDGFAGHCGDGCEVRVYG